MPTGRFVGTDRQLFLDRGLLGEADGIDVVVHPLQNTAEPVLVPDQPWETAADAFIGHVGSIMREEDGRFRLWYDYIYGTQHVEQPGDKGRCMAYAESADGVHFEKPLFAWHPMGGSSRTNILIPASRGGSVWIDPNAPPERRYRHQGKQALVIPGVRRVEFHAFTGRPSLAADPRRGARRLRHPEPGVPGRARPTLRALHAQVGARSRSCRPALPPGPSPGV